MTERFNQRDIAALKESILSSVHCALPGIVQDFDSATQTATVRPAVRCSPELPVLSGVPVFMPVPFTVSPGDACLLVFADLDIDAWLLSGAAAQPRTNRRHALSDAFAFVGFRAGAGNEED